ncbi:transposase [Corallococcus terminator]
MRRCNHSRSFSHPRSRPGPQRDWALRKGRTYGSILVDMEAHCVRDVLPDRSTPTVSAWLSQHPGVEVIARDRSTEYTRAAVLGTPEAQQVADRWHLLLNGRQMMERWMTSAHPRLRALRRVERRHSILHTVTPASPNSCRSPRPRAEEPAPGSSLHTKPVTCGVTWPGSSC